jgi:RNA polymerase sigma-70 factor (ECF subfamily)
MKLAIGDEVERTTAHARAVIRSSDEAGLVATKAANANGFDELFMRHEARIFRIALRITRNHEDAEDVVLQSFQKVFVHLRKFEGNPRSNLVNAHCHQRSLNVTAQKSRPAGNIESTIRPGVKSVHSRW